MRNLSGLQHKRAKVRWLAAILTLCAMILAYWPVISVADDVYFYRKTDTADGGYIMSGSTAWQGEIPPDACFARFDSAGQELWQITLGGSGVDDGLRAVEAVDRNTIVLLSTDSTDGDMADNVPVEHYNISYNSVVYKLDGSGEVVWKFPIKRMDGWAMNVVSADGGYLVTGQAYADFPWVIFLDDSGNECWHADYSDLVGGAFSYTGLLSNGNILHVGGFGTPIPESNFCTCEGWIVCTGATGKLLWSRKYSENDSDVITGFTELEDGSLLMCGATGPDIIASNYEPASVPWLLKTASDGILLWSKIPAVDHIKQFFGIYPFEDGLGVGTALNYADHYATLTIPIDEEGNILPYIDSRGTEFRTPEQKAYYAYMDMLEQTKGSMRYWSLEEKAEHSRLFIEAGYKPGVIYTLPAADDLQETDAITIAKTAIQTEYKLEAEQASQFLISSGFFIAIDPDDRIWEIQFFREGDPIDCYVVDVDASTQAVINIMAPGEGNG